MERLWAWKQVDAGILLTLLSLLVARDYLRTVPAPRPPGLNLAEVQPPLKPSAWSIRVGLVYVAAAVLGLVIAVLGLRRL